MNFSEDKIELYIENIIKCRKQRKAILQNKKAKEAKIKWQMIH